MSFPASFTLQGVLWTRNPAATGQSGEPAVTYVNTSDTSVHISLEGFTDYHRWARDAAYAIHWPRGGASYRYEYSRGRPDSWSHGANNGPDLQAADLLSREFWNRMLAVAR